MEEVVVNQGGGDRCVLEAQTGSSQSASWFWPHQTQSWALGLHDGKMVSDLKPHGWCGVFRKPPQVSTDANIVLDTVQG